MNNFSLVSDFKQTCITTTTTTTTQIQNYGQNPDKKKSMDQS
jgi:hypothetical protein